MKHLVIAIALFTLCATAAAGCSRPINVPVSSNGASVIIEADGVKGIYPDLLRGAAEKSGCRFDFNVVPRARQIALYKLGQADLLVSASETPERGQHGTFVPMISTRPLLISLEGNHAPISSAQELLARRDLRVAVVRGFDYGEGYTALVSELTKQGRVYMEVDVTAVARLLHAGSADLTIMNPSLMVAVARREPRVQGLFERLRTEAIPELPWRYSGAYVSHALGKEDQQALREMLEKIAKTTQVMDGYTRYFGADLLLGGVRPR